jgi:hypothetical protein
MGNDIKGVSKSDNSVNLEGMNGAGFLCRKHNGLSVQFSQKLTKKAIEKAQKTHQKIPYNKFDHDDEFTIFFDEKC